LWSGFLHLYSFAQEELSVREKSYWNQLPGLAYLILFGLIGCTQSCTSGRAGGLICEPLKAVWPAYAGIVTRISLVDRASYLLSLVPLCTLESGLHPAPPLTRNSPSPKSSVPQSSSPDP